MQNLKTKDGRNLKVMGIVAMPWGEEGQWTTVFICTDRGNKTYEPLQIPIQDVETFGN